jgi:hypothetical protein
MPVNRPKQSSPIVRFFKGLFLPNRFFIATGIVVTGFVMAYLFDFLFLPMQILGIAFIFVFVIDIFIV